MCRWLQKLTIKMSVHIQKYPSVLWMKYYVTEIFWKKLNGRNPYERHFVVFFMSLKQELTT